MKVLPQFTGWCQFFTVAELGHRLKSAKNKTVETLRRVKTLRRVILSGTPIQNDLGEFHAMVPDNRVNIRIVRSSFFRPTIAIQVSLVRACSFFGLGIDNEFQMNISPSAAYMRLRFSKVENLMLLLKK